MRFRSQVLDNGLQVVAECNDGAHSTAFGYFVDTGARDETPELAGVSHFLEHMAFKGTATRSADDVNREFDEMGAHYNAFTSDEQTVYYAAVLPEHQESALDLLTDIQRPSLLQEDFDTEKQVIIEEIRMYDDQPPFGADDRCKAAYFDGHALANSVLGTVQSVGQLRLPEMRDYWQRRYAPDNMLLAAAGRVDFEKLLKQVEKLTAGWTPMHSGRETARAPGRDCMEVLRRDAATQEYVLHLAPAPSALDEERYAAKLLTVMLGDDQGSRLYWELVDPGLVEGISLGHHDYVDSGAYMTYLCCLPPQTDDNLRRVFDVYAKAQQDGLQEEELILAKSKVNSRLVLSSEKPRNRMFSVGGNWQHRREYRSIREDLDRVAAINLDEIHQVLREYPLTGGTVFAIGPLRELSWRPQK